MCICPDILGYTMNSVITLRKPRPGSVRCSKKSRNMAQDFNKLRPVDNNFKTVMPLVEARVEG